MSEITVELIWCLGRAKDLRAHGEAAIPTHLDSFFGDHRDLFRRLGGVALQAAEDGDEVWSWHPAENCLDEGAIGLALVRGNDVVGYW